jgi:hypothetical protein
VGWFYFLVLGRGILFPISCEQVFIPTHADGDKRGGLKTLLHPFHLIPFALWEFFFHFFFPLRFFSCIDLSARAWELERSGVHITLFFFP